MPTWLVTLSNWLRPPDGVDPERLERDRYTGETQIALADIRDASPLAFLVPGENAGDAFRHPFRYAP